MNQETTILRVADYGAKADGQTDDSRAVAAALTEAADLDGPVCVLFEKGRVYRLASYGYDFSFPMPAGLILNGARDVTLLGEETTLLLAVPLKALCIRDCENIRVQGFRFDYLPKIALYAEVTAWDMECLSFDVRVAEPLRFEGNEFVSAEVAPDFFGLPESDCRRYHREHMYIDRYVRTQDPLTYRIVFRDDDTIRARMALTVENRYPFILPVPHVSHSIGEAFYVGFSGNVQFRDCEVWAAPHFVFCLKGNTGDLWFDNVNIRPNPTSQDPIAGWRDGYHCKDNRGAIHWNNCIVEKIHDDTFNISATLLYVTKVLSETEFVMACSEMGGVYYPLRAGDELTVFNIRTGKLSGNVRIQEVKEQNGPVNRVTVDGPCTLSVGDRVAVDSMASPGSEITGCRVDGTVRFRGRLTVRESVFNLLIMWLQNETLFEGPIPKHMLFEDCTINGYHRDEPCVTVKTEMERDGIPAYKCRDIVFRHCRIDPAGVRVQEGNEVRFE